MKTAHIYFHLSNSGLHLLKPITFRFISRRTSNKRRNRDYLQKLHYWDCQRIYLLSIDLTTPIGSAQLEIKT
jgi:hypothetical protein